MKSERQSINIENLSHLETARQNTGEIGTESDSSGQCSIVYQMKSEEQLYQYLRGIADQLGRPPTKAEVPGFQYIKARLGNWPRILEKAGIKPVSENRRYKLERRAQARKEKSQKKAAARARFESSIQGPM